MSEPLLKWDLNISMNDLLFSLIKRKLCKKENDLATFLLVLFLMYTAQLELRFAAYKARGKTIHTQKKPHVIFASRGVSF